MNVNYLFRRVGQAIFTFFIAVTLSFVLYHLMPGGPVTAMKSAILSNVGGTGSVSIDRIDQLVNLYTNVDPNQPIYIQYLNYLSDIVLHGDFGESFYKQAPVIQLIFQRLPWSIFISIYALAIGYSLSIVFGILSAYWETSRFDSTVSTVFITLNSIPYYIVGVLCIYVFALKYPILPRGGRVSPGLSIGFDLRSMWSLITHAVLPAISMGVLATSGVLTLRGNAIRVLGEGYVRVAELRGLRDSRIVTRYIGQNSILPMYTRFMIGIAGVLSSAVIVEQVFSYPGLGMLTFTAVKTQDYPLLMGTLIVFTTIALIGILIADLTYEFIDPRISASDSNE